MNRRCWDRTHRPPSAFPRPVW